ncbi:hypothetical protein HY546_03150, partial [archaeon]|nr:hypothetical protein [archaeon]
MSVKIFITFANTFKQKFAAGISIADTFVWRYNDILLLSPKGVTVKRVISALIVVGIVGLGFNSPLYAAEGLSSRATVSTSYQYRGTTKTDFGPALSGEFAYGLPWGFNFALGAGNVGADEARGIEYHTALTQSGQIIPVISYQLKAEFYHNPFTVAADTPNFGVEVKAFSYLALGAEYSRKFFGRGTSSTYCYLAGDFPLLAQQHFYLLPSVGYSRFGNEVQAGNKNYVDYRIAFAHQKDGQELEL